MPTATAAALTCNRLSLLEALTAVSAIVPSRSPKPILASVLLHATPDGTTLAATDLEVGVRHRVLGVQCDDPSRLVLPPARLKQILATADDEVVYLATEDDKLTIRGQRFRFTLSLEDPDLFPDVPEFTAASFVTVAPADLRKLIRCTIYATDPQSTRFALGGCLATVEGDTMTFVGTDGRRLARQTVPCGLEGAAVVPANSVLPLKGLKLIDRLLDDGDGSVEIAVDSKCVLVRTEQATVYSRLLEGRYPRWQDVFPTEATATVPFPEIGDLRQAVEQASIVTSETSRGVDFQFGNGVLKLVSQSADVGSSSVDLPINYAGPAIEASLDPRYLTDALRALGDDVALDVDLVDDKNAVAFRAGREFSYVVMPLTKER